MSAIKGQELPIEKEESGWAWVFSERGKYGWIPLENIEMRK
jgi:uncharacterized protein YgiM (DUF1202 family)